MNKNNSVKMEKKMQVVDNSRQETTMEKTEDIVPKNN